MVLDAQDPWTGFNRREISRMRRSGAAGGVRKVKSQEFLRGWLQVADPQNLRLRFPGPLIFDLRRFLTALPPIRLHKRLSRGLRRSLRSHHGALQIAQERTRLTDSP